MSRSIRTRGLSDPSPSHAYSDDEGEAILAGGERTGAVSSGAWGPSVGASLAFGYVSPEHAAPSTELEVMVPGEPRPARVLAEARYDPGNARPRS